MIAFWSWVLFFDCGLFLLLSLYAVWRIGLKVKQDKCGSWSGRSFSTFASLVTIFLYAIGRSFACFVFADPSIPINADGSFSTHLLLAVASAFFLMFQTALIHKWMTHVSDMSMSIDGTAIPRGWVLSISSFLFVSYLLVVLFAFLDYKREFWRLSTGTLNRIISVYCGFAYFVNGVCLIWLGFRFRKLWEPGSSAGARASNRILGVALFFGGVTVVRSIFLFMFLGDSDTNVIMHSLLHNDWAAPVIFFVEWLSVAVALLLLSRSKSGGDGSRGRGAHNPEANDDSSAVFATDDSSIQQTYPLFQTRYSRI